jgi:hypothetical protein
MKPHLVTLVLLAGCGGGSKSSDGGASDAGCGAVPNKMLHEDYCPTGLCLFDHPEGMGF